MNKTQRYDILLFYKFLNDLETERNIKGLEHIFTKYLKKVEQTLQFYN